MNGKRLVFVSVLLLPSVVQRLVPGPIPAGVIDQATLMWWHVNTKQWILVMAMAIERQQKWVAVAANAIDLRQEPFGRAREGHERKQAVHSMVI